MGVSLVSYTYNDAHLALELLEQVRTWTIRPRETVLVDDGSRPPFPPRPGVVLVAHAANRGAGVAKQAGISRCTQDAILSLDCDVRPPADWLEHALPLLDEPGVGLVGAPMHPAAGDSLSARYEQAFCGYYEQADAPGFLSGGIWLLRRATWLALGGFGGYEAKTYEDHHFCRRVREAGLTLRNYRHHSPVTLVRRMHYTDIVARYWAWSQPKSITMEQFRICDIVLAEDALARMEQALGISRPEFLYVDFLMAIHCYLRLAHMAGASPAGPLFRLLAGRLPESSRKTRALLAADLQRLGHDLTPGPGHTPPDLGAPLAALFAAAILRTIESTLLPAMQEAGRRFDYSFYRDL